MKETQLFRILEIIHDNCRIDMHGTRIITEDHYKEIVEQLRNTDIATY